jgi:2-polyprenyl-3-methyl-5-hydroxy-6-metoxy-1,4-benzoquinol methylase
VSSDSPASATLKCRVCNNESGNTRYTVSERMYGMGDEFEYFRCAECGCQQIVQVPANLDKYYPENYYSFSVEPLSGLRQKVTRLRNESYFRRIPRSIPGRLVGSMLPNPKLAAVARAHPERNARILDVGCGSGELLLELRNVGFTNLFGIEPYLPSNAPQADGVSVRKLSVDDIVDEKFDVIMLHHVFEHMPEPVETMKKLASLLASDGVLIVRIPVAHSWASQHYGPLWVQHDAPRHLFLHTEKSMQRIAAAAHLKVTKVVYDSDEAQIYGSELYRQNIPLLTAPRGVYGNPVRRLLSPKFIRYRAKTRRLNRKRLGDQAAFYLRF